MSFYCKAQARLFTAKPRPDYRQPRRRITVLGASIANLRGDTKIFTHNVTSAKSIVNHDTPDHAIQPHENGVSRSTPRKNDPREDKSYVVHL